MCVGGGGGGGGGEESREGRGEETWGRVREQGGVDTRQPGGLGAGRVEVLTPIPD